MSQECVLCREPFRREKEKYLVKGKSKLNLFFELESLPLASITKDQVVSMFGSGQLGLRRYLSEKVRPAANSYRAERGRSISILEALKFSLKNDSGKCLRYVCVVCLVSHDIKIIKHVVLRPHRSRPHFALSNLPLSKLTAPGFPTMFFLELARDVFLPLTANHISCFIQKPVSLPAVLVLRIEPIMNRPTDSAG